MLLDKHSQMMKLGVLQKIKDLMDSIEGDGMKKPDATMISVKAEGSPEEEAAESPLEEAAEPKDDGDEDEDLKKLMAEYEARMK
jgi:hypothetical protein